ncbi:MAG TPA: TonB-dependent receptor, partial [Gemmatimonadaceae bacterium]|nr:TonB-dependent receptor [Gemmatimonadaceae bacterium]
PALARAQLTVQGRVLDEGGRPISGAQVRVEGATIGTVAGADGAYRLVIREPRPPVTLLARLVGYHPGRATVTEDSGTVTRDFALSRDVLQLSQIVVTGTGAATERSQLGATISTVDGEELTTTAVPQVDAALAGKVAGALVTSNSGTPGGGTSVRIRGLSTLSRSAEPLYIVDGIIVDNSSTQLVDLGGYTTNRLADLDPNEIERIEVVKGAAAAALYGSRANDGVVQIFTKRGRAGATRFTLRTTAGLDKVEHFVPVNQSPVNAAGAPVTRYDYQDQIFQTAPQWGATLSMSGGDERTQFFLSGSLLDQEGVLRSTDYERRNLRLNLDRRLSDRLRLAVSTSYISSDAELTPNGGLVANTGVLTSFLFQPNDINLFPDPVTGEYPKGFSLANPLDIIANWGAPQNLSRFIGGLQLQGTPGADITFDFRFGYDTYTETGSQFVPRNSSAVALAPGLAVSASDRARLINADLDLSHTAQPSSSVKLTTSAGVNWQQQRYDVVTARAEDLAPLVVTVTGSRQFAGELRDDRRTLGVYAQEQVGISDMLFLTAGLRADAASAFGSDERTQYFPKFGASFDVSAMDWWQGRLAAFVTRLRLRAALGYSGGQPTGSFDRLNNYVFEPSGINAGVVNSTQQGNQQLRPERQREIEGGADVELFGGRLGIEATYFNKEVTDLILPRTVRPSSGFLSQLANVGVLENQGIELLVRSVNVEAARWGWTTSATLSTNNPDVTQVSDGGAFFIPQSFDVIRVAANEPPGHFWGTTYVRDAQGRIVDAAGVPVVNESGATVGIPAIGPRGIIGDPNPDLYWTLTNEVTLGSSVLLRLQLDAVHGLDVFNFDRRLLETPAFGSGAEYARELQGEVPAGYFQARRSIFEEYIEDGSFVKVREASVSYTLPESVTRLVRASGATVTLAGRNLKTWTDYTGWDPEANVGAQRTLVRGFSFATTPIPRNVTLGVTVNF